MKRFIAFLLLCCLLLSLVACSKPQEEPIVEEDEPIKEPFQTTTLLTSAEVQHATGIAVGEAQQAADGQAVYVSADQQIVYLDVQEMTATAFDEMLTTLSAEVDTTDAPNLGEKAVWCESLLNLYVYADGWGMEIRVEYAPTNADDSLLASRQLAVLLLEKL